MFDGRINLQSLQRRSISAAVMIVVVIAILYMGGWAFIGLLGLLALISLIEWVQLALRCLPRLRYIYLFAALPYVVGSFLCCYLIFTTLGFFWAMVFLVMVWTSDSGGYFVGKTVGGPKMIEAISPNKTWSGMIGALVAPMVVGAFAMILYRGINDFSLMAVVMMGMTGIFIGLAGQTGDLVISAFKRKAGVKDTGALIPGHGGLLDRIDSMMLAAPVYLILFAIGHA